ncbi:polysaccharide biosynthesis/export family protein [Sphingomonas sp. PP-CC-3A-396]|uniref:polysaccharide biosynthesis/export family protein n=1 Tax=Sphingomonas sp. PP-CC-3A-396 TaxID=2135655 RepID=UPI001045B3EE|nr:polysaccharide biosynthesis/export family protein [Sphingomonas sp. PP-CC-3A-396]TCQ03029.1 polysaccharide export outer membrane protein [Sphingomonas sp. PP-CC-3A-396]
MRKAWTVMIMVLVGCVLQLHAASAQSATQVPATTPSAMSATTPTSAMDASDYTLGVADKVRITVFNEPSMTGEYPVNANGKVSMPLIGEVQAAGSTAGALRVNIERMLADGYLINPRVGIDVLTFRPFYILGEVTKPGEYPSTAGLSVMNAVATAQGFTYRANKKYVYVKRSGSSKEQKIKLTSDVMIMPGDTIRVGERFF